MTNAAPGLAPQLWVVSDDCRWVLLLTYYWLNRPKTRDLCVFLRGGPGPFESSLIDAQFKNVPTRSKDELVLPDAQFAPDYDQLLKDLPLKVTTRPCRELVGHGQA